MRKTIMAVVLCALVVGIGAQANADDGFNAQLFWPALFGGNFIAVEDSQTLCPWGFGGGLIVNYADSLVVRDRGEDYEMGVLNSLLTTDVLVGLGTFSFLSVGADVPIHFYARGRTFEDLEQNADLSDLETNMTLGDVRAEIKARLLEQEKHWLGMALAPFATFPTGDETLLLGEGRITGGGNLILEHDFGLFNLGLNGGYQYRGDFQTLGTNLGDAWKAGAGISREFDSGLSFSVEYWGAWYDSGSTERLKSNPMELMGTLRYRFGKEGRGPRLIAGGGGGISEGVGSPSYRIVGGVDYYYCRPESTDGALMITIVDQDGQPLNADLTINGPIMAELNASYFEELKAPQGMYDISAALTGYQPVTTSGIVEVEEATEITITLQAIPTTLAIVVTDIHYGEMIETEIVVNAGQPGEQTLMLAQGELSQNWEPGSHTLSVSAKGHETKQIEIEVLPYQHNEVSVKLARVIVQIGKIFFDFNSDKIRPQSYVVLDDIVTQIDTLPPWRVIVIEGHCSDEGSDEYNLRLSNRRAASVRKYLISKGVDADKLESVGFGEGQPIASNETEEGREKNRRVEFKIDYIEIGISE
ncbi:MAG: OmpA family protein [Candidatus Alcyoniella australis]|nr:OmpA family protein [Candidatus Alcyoniella australis]